MNKTIKQLILMAALAMAWGCSSSGDDDIANENGGDSPSSQFTATMIKTEKEPDWQIDLTMDDEAPEWTAPDASNFESSMTVLVKLSEPLVPYSTDDDRMAIFVNDECRAVSVRNMNVLESYKEVFFVLNIRGTASNENADEYVLKYYSGGAHHLFTISDPNAARAFVSEYIRTDFETDMLYGNHKYPVKVLANIMLPFDYPVPYIDYDNDLIGAFINGECRGLVRPGPDKFITILTDKIGEYVELRYYSSVQGAIYIMKDNVKLLSTSMTMDFKF